MKRKDSGLLYSNSPAATPTADKTREAAPLVTRRPAPLGLAVSEEAAAELVPDALGADMVVVGGEGRMAG